MNNFIDTVFGPLNGWLIQMRSYLSSASVPVARPIRIEDYLGYLVLLGPGWISFISTVVALAVIYGIIFVVMASQGLVVKFKDTVKWW